MWLLNQFKFGHPSSVIRHPSPPPVNKFNRLPSFPGKLELLYFLRSDIFYLRGYAQPRLQIGADPMVRFFRIAPREKV